MTKVMALVQILYCLFATSLIDFFFFSFLVKWIMPTYLGLTAFKISKNILSCVWFPKSTKKRKEKQMLMKMIF